jgi:hypothetical protein
MLHSYAYAPDDLEQGWYILEDWLSLEGLKELKDQLLIFGFEVGR